MAQNQPTSKVPAELVQNHRFGWHVFTKAIVIACLGVTAFLLLGLLYIKA